MIIKKLKIYNFFTFKNVELELEQLPYFITGENRDETSASSNGSGKSLLVQSMLWCLFGDILRKNVKADDVIGPNGDYTEVSMIIERNSQTFEINRYRNHPAYKNNVRFFVDKEDVSQHKDNDEFIQEVLGINQKIFYQCAYNDKRKETIVNLTPAKLKEVIAEILDVERFDKYIKSLRGLKSKNEVKLEKISSSFSIKEKNKKDLEQNKEWVLDDIKRFEDEKFKKLESLKEEEDDAQKEHNSLEFIYENNVENLSNDLAEMREYLLENKDSVEGIQALIKVNGELKSDVRLATAKSEQITQKIYEIQKIISNKEVCSFCGGDIKDRDVFDKHEKELLELEKQFSDNEISITNIKEKLRSGEDDELKLKQLYDEYSKIKNAYITKKSVLKKHQENYVDSVEKFEKLKKSLIIKRDKINQETINIFEERISSLESSIKDVEDEIEKDRELFELVKTEIDDSNTLVVTLQNIKTSIFNSFVWSLQENINKNFEEMTDGDFRCELDDSNSELVFKFTSTSKNGKAYPYSVFSDGEQARISKAVSVALEDLLQIGFVIDDEGLSNVDASGITMILDFIINKNRNKSYFFVGHHTAFKDYFADLGNIHVIKENGISSATLV